jgi:CHRD domain
MLETKIKVLLSTIPVGLLGALLILMVQSAPVPALAQSGQETFFEEAVRQAGQTQQQQNETGGAPATAPAAAPAAPAATAAPPSSAEQQNQTEAAPAPAAQQEQQTQDYDANLTGSMQVPPVTTNATGLAELELNDDGDEISYDIQVEDIEGATQAHIHQGSEGENGDVVVSLFNSSEPTDVNDGTLEDGDFTSEDFVGPLQGQNMSALVELMDNGQSYVNVHTEANPDGEIRGTIVPDVTDGEAGDDDNDDNGGGGDDDNDDN